MKNIIEIKSAKEDTRFVEKFIDDFKEEIGLEDEIYGKLMLATMEATYNAVIHGNKLDPGKKVIVEIIKKEEWIEVYVEDQGKGFDFMRIPDPTAPENIENIHGRGIYLIKQLADEVNFYKGGRKVQIFFKYE